MARNKYPEETVEKILSVSWQLFLEQGYDRTSIQDIIDRLGGLTKGAIYHHFRSKEDILFALTDRFTADTERMLRSVRDDAALNARSKLRRMFALSLCNPGQQKIFSLSPSLLDNPHFTVLLIRSVFEDVVPHYIDPILREGQRDGSIHTQHPRELAETLMLLSNLWLNPLVLTGSASDIRQRFAFYTDLMHRYGLDFLDDIMQEAADYYAQAHAARQDQQTPR